MDTLKFPNWDQAQQFLVDNGYRRKYRNDKPTYFAKFGDGQVDETVIVTTAPDETVTLEITVH